MNKYPLYFFLLYLFNISHLFAATMYAPAIPINHCYHWIDEGINKYISYKYDYASKHRGALTFHSSDDSTHGREYGKGLYCAKAPSSSYFFGDRVIKIIFIQDLILFDDINKIQYCGTLGETSLNSKTCATKKPDIRFIRGGSYGELAWYLILNPLIIKEWSANSLELENELNQSVALNPERIINELKFKNKTIPGSSLSFASHTKKTIRAMQKERQSLGQKIFFPEDTPLSFDDFLLSNLKSLGIIHFKKMVLKNNYLNKLALIHLQNLILLDYKINILNDKTSLKFYPIPIINSHP